jgi:amino acid transporter
VALDLRIVTLSVVVVFIAVIVLFYVLDGIVNITERCEKDKSLRICRTGTLPIAILMMLLIVGGLIVIVNITAYVLISGASGKVCET